MPEYNNQEIAQTLSEVANLLEIQGENPFRIRAYRKAALVITNLPQPLSRIFGEQGEQGLENLPGVGKNIAQKIVELLQTGQLAQYQHLQQQVPLELAHLVDIRGLGAARLRILHQKLGVNKLDDLKKAALAGKIRNLEGFGARSEENILKGIAEFEKHQGRFPMATVLPYAQVLVDYLKQVPGVEKVETAGSLRRYRETIGDLDILVTGTKDSPVMEKLVAYERVKEVIARGETKTSVLLDIGIQADIRLLSPASFGAGMHYFTGSQQHNIAMRHRAQERGLKLNEYGLFQGEKKVGGVREEEIFQLLGLDFIPPQLREDQGEIEAAEKGVLPRLVEQSDLKGDLHAHTTYSEGYNTLEEMAQAASRMGYQYLAITDHSKSQTQANGMDEARLGRQMEAIDRINAELKGLKLLKGIEVDILKDGSLDLSREILQQLDCVVASIHASFNLPKQEMTVRFIQAIRSGVVHIIGHPTARLILEREPVELDMVEILKVAREHNVAMELNAYGKRLDLNDVHCRLAKQMGVKLAVSTDAHNALSLANIQYGIFTAQRGWLEPGDVINTLPYEQLMKFLRR